MTRMTELEQKLARVRLMMAANNVSAVHVAALGNLAWLLCGADLAVALTGAPVAEAVVTQQGVSVLASSVERGRLETEELPGGVNLVYTPWYDPQAKEETLKDLLGEGKILSDTPGRGFETRDFWPLRVPLLPEEVARYRELGADTARAFTDVLTSLTPGLSEHEVAGRLAEGLRAHGAQPVVLLVAGDERLERYKHPLPQAAVVNKRLMAVACARRHGLIASVTRLVSFGPEPSEKRRQYGALLEVERVVLEHTRHGLLVTDVFAQVQEAYAKAGRPQAWQEHHQGGPTGYFTRDFVATSADRHMLVEGSAYAWNPSLPGLKVEDTVLLTGDTLTVLTEDDRWPLREVGGRRRPEVLEL